jgi:polyisoprenoid-binding protein YceI
MNLHSSTQWTGLIGLALLLAASVQAQNAIRYDAQPGSKVKVEGTSTIHDWAVESRAVGGFMEVDPAFDADLKTVTTTPKVEVTIPVRQLKNADNKTSMDNIMWEHMNLKTYPKISYRLLTLKPKDGAAAGSASQFDATGALTVSGVTRTNNMAVTMERVDKSKIKVRGITNLKMTDFGIKPPAPAIGLGMIKTGDDVKLSFEWTVAKVEKTADAK